ncbi:hypothetical protein RB195_005575 [Necator americanus]|uniref:G-protein coupled receptors family 1 profile domain-containing protein n=1 Tax=Necator americanus TaxID=51031 RepID=A0ABR1BNL8_NECAM
MNCTDAAEYMLFTPQRVILFVHVSFCISSIIVNLLFVKYCRKDVFFHCNCKVLLWTLVVINIAHSLFLGTLQGTHLYKLFTASNPCDLLVPAVFCYSLRMPSTMCFSAHITIHLSIVIERAVALKYLSTYERSTPVAGFALVFLSVKFYSSITIQTNR